MHLRHRGYLTETKQSISKDDVLDILVRQPGNKDRDRDFLERWVPSVTFHLMDVYVGLNDLGISQGKTGQTVSAGQPIIIDDNVNMVARSFRGIGGTAPDFLVVDGQNRIVAARAKNIRGIIKAYVGDKIISKVKRKNSEAKKIFDEVDQIVRKYSSSSRPGLELDIMKRYVERGLMSSEELASIRAEWKKKYGSKQ